MTGRSETLFLGRCLIIFSRLFSAGGHRCLVTSHCNVCNSAEPKPISWAKPPYSNFYCAGWRGDWPRWWDLNTLTLYSHFSRFLGGDCSSFQVYGWGNGPETKLCTLDVLNSDGGLTLGVLSELFSPWTQDSFCGRSFHLQMKFSKLERTFA
jgi:hypothetical protein